ncbi:hypothetical protein ACIOEX_27015 [Streptomyces sp. NPDC087850]|uniref:hypothetical protein n=1 Tax=unclassified Streptomyces TaxID=2593676 RepID=UPI0037F82151
MGRVTATAVRTAALAMGSFFVLAPVGVTPKGCGDLSGGRLCVEGPVGGSGTFTTRYVRNAGGADIPVRLGYQRRDARITAFPGWFGTERTRQGRAELAGAIDTEPGECIRGVLDDLRDGLYVTRWHCS